MPSWEIPTHTLETVTAELSADVTMTNADQFYDGPSVSLRAGKWFVTGAVCVSASGTTQLVKATAKLWDGTTVYASGYATAPSMGSGTSAVQIPLSAVITLTGTTTIKISAAEDSLTGQFIRAAAPANGAGNNASFLRAMRIG
jgi:hypothetical protein